MFRTFVHTSILPHSTHQSAYNIDSGHNWLSPCTSPELCNPWGQHRHKSWACAETKNLQKSSWTSNGLRCHLVSPTGDQGFEPWFQLELESDWELPRRDFPFKASSGCKYRRHVGCPLSKDIWILCLHPGGEWDLSCGFPGMWFGPSNVMSPLMGFVKPIRNPHLRRGAPGSSNQQMKMSAVTKR